MLSYDIGIQAARVYFANRCPSRENRVRSICVIEKLIQKTMISHLTILSRGGNGICPSRILQELERRAKAEGNPGCDKKRGTICVTT